MTPDQERVLHGIEYEDQHPEWMDIYTDTIETFCSYSFPLCVSTKQEAIDDLEGLINGVSEELERLRRA